MSLLRSFVIVLSSLVLAMLSITASAAAAPAEVCEDPAWTSLGPGGGRGGPGIYAEDSPYILDNNMWNAEGYDITQTMSVCDHASWYVDVMVPGPTDSAVKTYPNVHVDFHDWGTGSEPRVSSFDSITSSYAGEWTGEGVYNVAYDLWLNGVGGGANEVMIWTENNGQRPAGSVVASDVTLSGKSWDVWATSSNHYIAFVPTDGQAYPSGTLDLLAFLDFAIQQGQLPGNSTLGQVDYGVEVVSTGDDTARFDATDFSLSTDPQIPVIKTNEPTVVWPANHSYTTLHVRDMIDSVRVGDLQMPADEAKIVSVFSDEPENADEDGRTNNDIAISDDAQSVKIRQERQGDSNGRVYTVTLGVSVQGVIGFAQHEIEVPLDRDTPTFDDGESTGYTVVSDHEFDLQRSCTEPTWTSTEPFEWIFDDPYILGNNMWNAEGYNITQTLNVCGHDTWYVDVVVPEPADTAVKTYPNVHQDWHNWSTGEEPAVSTFDSITSTYAGEWTGEGVYNVAYDIWLNGVGGGANEVMIWTENNGQRPAGSVVASDVTLSGKSWDVWATSSNHYIAFVPTDGQAYPSGTLDMLAFVDYAIQQGRLPGTSTLGQIGYGVEIVSSGGGTARFATSDFSISSS